MIGILYGFCHAIIWLLSCKGASSVEYEPGGIRDGKEKLLSQDGGHLFLEDCINCIFSAAGWTVMIYQWILMDLE